MWMSRSNAFQRVRNVIGNSAALSCLLNTIYNCLHYNVPCIFIWANSFNKKSILMKYSDEISKVPLHLPAHIMEGRVKILEIHPKSEKKYSIRDARTPQPREIFLIP